MTLQIDLECAKDEVARIENLIRRAKCAEIGSHDWKFTGGRNAGCGEQCVCSVPVHTCRRCLDCDYGHNDEATAIIRECDDKGDR